MFPNSSENDPWEKPQSTLWHVWLGLNGSAMVPRLSLWVFVLKLVVDMSFLKMAKERKGVASYNLGTILCTLHTSYR